MNLFIQIENGQPINHPATEENLIQAFGSIPDHWVPFKRIHLNESGVYLGVYQNGVVSYQLASDGITWQDVWAAVDMTTEEKTAKQQKVKNWFASKFDAYNFKAWTFNEDTCSYDPPISMPQDGKHYFWQGTTNSWVEYPPYPTDGLRYYIDYANAKWVTTPPTPT
jgi:hypothetical protein